MKTALVTGASTGVGREVAVELGRLGWKVGVVARRKEKLEETKNMVEVAGGSCEVFGCDLSDVSEVNSLIQKVKAWTTQLDALVNIAGVWHGESEVYAGIQFNSFDQNVVLKTLNVGLVAPVLLAHGLLAIMPRKSCVVNLSGTFENGAKGWIPYYVSKKGLEDFSQGLSEEFIDQEIRVNCISPSDTATEEYQKYFPEDAVDANGVSEVAELVVKVITGNKTGQFWVIKRGVVTDGGFHK